MAANIISKQYKLSSYSTERDWLFGFPTATIDRFSPAVEEVYLPAAISREGELKIELDLARNSISYSQVQPRLAKLKSLVVKDSLTLEANQIGLDMRINSPQNWAHSITNHLPLSLRIKDMLKELDKGLDEGLVVIFPSNISGKILDIFSLAGFSWLTTDAPVQGSICKFELLPWISMRGERCDFVRSGLQGTQLIEKLAATDVCEDRIFLSRRKTRTSTNEAEIIEFLEKRGFKTLYAEDYSPIEQLAYIAKAKEIVSVHGAALGPMIIRSAYARSENYKLIEIFSPAHVTNAWRMIAHQQGARWAAVRGRVWPDLVKDKADFVSNMSNFEVSLDSLQSALNCLEIQ